MDICSNLEIRFDDFLIVSIILLVMPIFQGINSRTDKDYRAATLLIQKIKRTSLNENTVDLC